MEHFGGTHFEIIMKHTSYLQISRHNIFYTRFKLPKALSPFYDKQVIRTSLRTRDLRLAKTRCYLAAGIIRSKFFELTSWLNMQEPRLSVDKLREVVREELDRSLASLKANFESAAIEVISKVLHSQLPELEDIEHKSIEPEVSEVNDLEKLIDSYCQEKILAGIWSQRTKDESLYTGRLLVRILGNVDVTSIEFEEARKLKEIVMQLPPHLSKNKDYIGMTIHEIVESKPEKVMSITTMNRILGMASSIWEYGKRHGYVSINYFDGLQLAKVTRAKEERLPFSDDDLHKLFSTDIYIDGNYKKNFHYWIPLLGLYTGCRLNELCSLTKDDVKKEGDIYYLDINDDGDKHVKNKSSIRKVPLHPMIVDLGFIDFIYKANGRLFPELKKVKDNYSHYATKWFCRSYLRSCGIDDSRKVYHSYRHTVTQRLINMDVSKEVVGAILGHFDGSQTTGRYGDGFSLQILHDAISKLDVPIILNKLG